MLQTCAGSWQCCPKGPWSRQRLTSCLAWRAHKPSILNAQPAQFGIDCAFSHDPDVLFPRKTGKCLDWETAGTCKWGDRCRYLHSETEASQASIRMMAQASINGSSCPAFSYKGVASDLNCEAPQGSHAGYHSRYCFWQRFLLGCVCVCVCVIVCLCVYVCTMFVFNC